jgi:DNA-binding CsgD family transcriptional regulator
MEVEGFAVTVAAVQRWLPLGRDVLLRGDRGSGKTTVLEALLADASRRGMQGMLLRSGGAAPLSTLLDHASVPPRTHDETVLAAWLAEELGGRRSLLLVDDVDRIDLRSLGVVRRVLARTPCLLVAATTVDALRHPTEGMREVLLQRAPAEVRVPPFGFRAVANLLASVLGAPADAGLISSVMAQTGGNPRAVVALADAARAGGALSRVDGLWVDTGTLVEVPVDAVAYVYLSGVRSELVDALEFLASIGPVPADVAADLLDPEVLAELGEIGRVVSHQVGAEEMLGVSPPVLARALRERVSTYRRRQLADRVDARTGPSFTPHRPHQDELTAVLLGDADGETDEYWRWTAELAGLVHERATVEEAARRAAWLESPTLRTANDYLALLMRRPAAEQLRAVFESTRPGERDREPDKLEFAYYRARWMGWCGATTEEVDAALATSGAELGPFLTARDLKRRVLRELQEGRSPDAVAAEPPADVPFRLLRGVTTLVRAAALLEGGWPAQAIQVCDTDDVSGAEPEIRHYVAAVRGQALALCGRLDEAEQWQRRMLDAAYDEVDALGIRVHACVLAEVLYLRGQGHAAWRVVSTALRLGPAGPVETTFYRRGLTVGAVLQARAGNVTLAEVMVRELDKTPGTYHPLVRSMRVLARVATAAAAGDTETSGQTAWQAGQAYADDGLLEPALLAWVAAPATMTPNRARTVREVLARTRVPLLEPYVRLLLAVAEQDRETAAEVLDRVQGLVAPDLVRAAEEMLGLDPSRTTDGAPPAARRGMARVEPLSVREREVAVLAQDGLSNRQIADRLHLSVRTVENHMSRALRKLGFTNRGDLLGWREP